MFAKHPTPTEKENIRRQKESRNRRFKNIAGITLMTRIIHFFFVNLPGAPRACEYVHPRNPQQIMELISFKKGFHDLRSVTHFQKEKTNEH